jgi:hypothetical protein
LHRRHHFRSWGSKCFFARRSRFQMRNFFQRQTAKFSGRNIERKWTILHAPDLLHVMPDLFKHLADLAIAAFDDRDFEPGIISLTDLANLRRCCAHPAPTFFGDRNALSQFIELGVVGLPCNLDHIDLGHIRRRFHQRICQFAVVGKQQKAFAGPIEPSDRIHAGFGAADQVHNGRAFFGIAYGGDVAFWLVQYDIGMPFRPAQQFTVDADVILL